MEQTFRTSSLFPVPHALLLIKEEIKKQIQTTRSYIGKNERAGEMIYCSFILTIKTTNNHAWRYGWDLAITLGRPFVFNNPSLSSLSDGRSGERRPYTLFDRSCQPGLHHHPWLWHSNPRNLHPPGVARTSLRPRVGVGDLLHVWWVGIVTLRDC